MTIGFTGSVISPEVGAKPGGGPSRTTQACTCEAPTTGGAGLPPVAEAKSAGGELHRREGRVPAGPWSEAGPADFWTGFGTLQN